MHKVVWPFWSRYLQRQCSPKTSIFSITLCTVYTIYIFWRFCRKVREDANRPDNKAWDPKQNLFYVVSITVIQRLVQRSRIPLLDLFDTLDYFTSLKLLVWRWDKQLLRSHTHLLKQCLVFSVGLGDSKVLIPACVSARHLILIKAAFLRGLK